MTKLVLQLVKRIPNSEPDRDAIALQAKAFKAKIAEIIKAQPDAKKVMEKPSMDETSVAKMFEEVKVMFQDLPARLSDGGGRKQRYRRFHPMMFEEMMHMSGRNGDPVGLLMMLSVFRDDMPWLYELGRVLYDALKRGNANEVEKALETFMRVSEMSSRGPWAEEFMSGSKDSYIMMRELPMMIHHYARKFNRRAVRRPPEKPEGVK